jgi:hypothetical protein
MGKKARQTALISNHQPTTTMKYIRALSILLLLCGGGQAAEKPFWEYPTLKMPAWHAQAVELALREFRKNRGGHTDKGEPVYGDLRHYSVHIISEGDEVEVAFIPDAGPKDIKNATTGGRSQFGIEVYYHISRNVKLLRTTFAR